jgi:hypothetical protein
MPGWVLDIPGLGMWIGVDASIQKTQVQDPNSVDPFI